MMKRTPDSLKVQGGKFWQRGRREKIKAGKISLCQERGSRLALEKKKPKAGRKKEMGEKTPKNLVEGQKGTSVGRGEATSQKGAGFGKKGVLCGGVLSNHGKGFLGKRAGGNPSIGKKKYTDFPGLGKSAR